MFACDCRGSAFFSRPLAMQRSPKIRDHRTEATLFRRRALVGFTATLISLVGLAAWYFKLQVLDHDLYATRSDQNRIRLKPSIPARGMIYDRRGRLLADNVPAFRLVLTPEEVANVDDTIREISTIIPLGENELDSFKAALRVRRRGASITLKSSLTEEEMARFAIDLWRFPGLELQPHLIRHYPYGDLLSHIIGYVGQINEQELSGLGVEGGALTHIGKSGIERYYETELRGKIGYEQVETNAQGRSARTIGRLPAHSGKDLRLSIDIDLQQVMTEAFGSQEGAAIAVDPRTGEVLAMVSLPSYDPNMFIRGMSHSEFNAINSNPSRPQFNRLVLGGVAPGSTIKPLIGLAGLDSGLRRPDDSVLSTGMFYLPGYSRGWGDSHRGGHGWTDLSKSIAQSVNTYYYKLALELGIERFDSYMEYYGFGQPTGIDLPGEIGGILPSPDVKRKSRKQPWYPGDTVNVSIGQGDWSVTPVQLVQGVAGIADGQLRRPHLVVQERGGFDEHWTTLPLSPGKPVSRNPSNVQAIRDGMMATMRPGGGAWRAAVGASYAIAGKTGTAQVISRRGAAAVNPKSLPLHLRHRALFVGFAPADYPEIAIAVAVEGGGYGGAAAAPIARKVFDAWLSGASGTDAGNGHGDAQVHP